MSRMLARYCRHACSSEPPDATPRHARYAPAAVLMPALCVSGCAWIPVHSSGIISESQPTFCLYGARIASRLARGKAPSNPGKSKGRECIQANPSCVLSSGSLSAIHEKRDTMRLNDSAISKHVELHYPEVLGHSFVYNVGGKTEFV